MTNFVYGFELSGTVLPHDNFGSHLNAKGETIDKELEKNFRYAGEILAKSVFAWTDAQKAEDNSIWYSLWTTK